MTSSVEKHEPLRVGRLVQSLGRVRSSKDMIYSVRDCCRPGPHKKAGCADIVRVVTIPRKLRIPICMKTSSRIPRRQFLAVTARPAFAMACRACERPKSVRQQLVIGTVDTSYEVPTIGDNCRKYLAKPPTTSRWTRRTSVLFHYMKGGEI